MDCHMTSAFWAAQLQAAKRTPFPVVPRDAAATGSTTQQFEASLPLSLPDASITKESILRAAWAIVLGRYCDTDDVCFGMATSSRRQVVPVRVRLHPQQRVSDFLGAIQVQAAEMTAHEQFGLQNFAKISVDAMEACDFTNILIITSSESSQLSEEASPNYPLITEISLLDDESAKLNFIFNSSALSKFQLGALSQQLSHVVRQLGTLGDEPLSTISLTGPWDLDQAIQWCGRKSEIVPFRLHDLVAEQVVRRPQCEAIYAWDGVLTYTELDVLSDQVSRYLRCLGVGVGHRGMVPVCFEKSLWAIVAMLGVIKAGGAWVPLNPAHPASRLQEIVSGVDALVVLVSPTTSKTCEGIAKNVVEISAASLESFATKAAHFKEFVSGVDNVVTLVAPTTAKDCDGITENIVEVSYASSNASSETLAPTADELAHVVMSFVEPTPSDAAYVIFTSGSTGTPNGIVIEHGAVCASLRGQEREYGINTSSRVLQFSSYVFDACIADIWLTLVAGGTVCIPSETQRLENVASFIREARVNVGMGLTPSFVATINPDDVPGITTLLVAAEAPTKETIVTWQPRVERLLNGYGPTETVVMCTYHEYKSPDDNPATIGRNFTGRGWIVDADNHNRLAPIGCVGELLMESSGLARGYLNNEAKTQAAFIHEVGWWPTDLLGPSNRFYKTGDLVKFNTDGTILYIGRKDTQVKVRGQRVELGEIEHKIRTTLPNIEHVAVDVVRRKTGDLLTAWMSFDDACDLGATGTTDVDNFLPMDNSMRERIASLAAELQASLPSYMVPAVFLPLRTMLFNTSMKIDRVSLRASIQALGSGLSVYSLVQADDADKDDGEPLTPMESKLQELWSQILKVPAESITRNKAFLQIGGDSISAIRLVNLARKEGISLEMANIFANSRLSHMATTAKMEDDAAALEISQFSLLPSDEVESIVAQACEQCGLPSRDTVEDIYPCTSLQEGLMALSIKQPGSYVATFVYKLPEDVNLDRFQVAWDRTVELCSNLRTRIALIEGDSIQVIVQKATGWHASTEGEASDLTSTQADLQSIPMSYGSPLCRYAIAREPSGENYIVLSLHHAIYDGWSFRLMTDTLKTQYQGAGSQVATQTELPPYSRFIRYTLGLDLEAAASYWKAQLHGAKKTAFPAAPRNASASITQEVSASIEIPRAASTTITKASIIRAAWAIVLARYCDTDDICFAVTVSGRQAPVPGLDGMAGPVIAAVPIRVRLDPRQTVADFLSQIQAQASEMAVYEQYGLQNIAKVSADAREACDFANLMVIQPSQVADESDDAVLLPAGAACASGEGIAGFFNYPLMAEFVLLGDSRAQLNFTFDASVISAFQLDALSRQLDHVVGQLAAQGDQLMGALSLTSPWDLQQAVLFSGVSKPEVARARLEDLLAEQVQRTPDSEAIVSWDGSLKYSELDSYSTKLASHLRSLGVGPSVMIPICFEKSKWAIVAMVAVVKAGGGWVPLNPQHPPARLRMIIEDVAAPIMLVSSSEAKTCHGIADQIVEVSAAILTDLPEVDEAAVHPTESTPDDVAYIMFTSGSTGKPKGIVVQHWALCSSIRCQIEEYQTSPYTRVIQFANYVFDGCIADIFVALCSGGTVCVPSDIQRLQDIAGFIREAGVNTAIAITPSFAATIPPKECPGLTKIVLGAEAVTRETLDIWFGHAELYNAYGPSETLVMCTSYQYTSRDEAPGTIGRLFTGRAWIVEVNDHHKLAPIGCVGELLIESTPMAQGYLNDKAKTQAAFVDHVEWWPATALDNGDMSRFYKSGDLVKFREDGMLSYIGRKDTQVKIRGQRIELGEIEHAIRRGMPDIEQVAVDVVSRESGDVLIAFATLANADDQDGDENVLVMTDGIRQRFAGLTDKLRATLPSYMIPSLFLPMRSMLFNASMKIDRSALRASAQALGEGLSAYFSVQADDAEPSTPIELRLQKLWAQVLKIPIGSIKKNSKFLQIGGDSIGAIRLITLARQKGISLDIATIFQDSRLSYIATTASLVEETATAALAPEPFSLLPSSEVDEITAQAREQCRLSADEEVEDIYPCTALQEGLMALTDKQPGSYVASFVHRIPAEVDLDLDKFQAAWERTVELCSNLRTRVVLVGGHSFQAVVRNAKAWHVAGTPDLASALALLDSHSMGYGTSLCRAAMAVGPNGEYHFALAIHHATYDGWGFQLVLKTLQLIYHRSTSSELPPYSLFIKYTQGIDQDAASKYWKEQLKGAKHSGYPLIGRNADPDKSITQIFEATISLPRSTGTSITKASLLRAAWALVLARHCDLDDVCFAMTVSGRQAPVPGLEKMAGPTIATVPVRVRLNPNQSVADFLQGIQAQASEMAAYEQYGLQNISKVSSDAREACNFTNLIVIQPAPTETSDESPKTILVHAESEGSAADKGLEGFFNYPLITEVVLQEDQAKLNFTFDASILSEFELHALSQQLSHVVQQLSSTGGEEPMSKVTLASSWDLEQAIKWSGEKSEVVHARLEEVISHQVLRGPDREAIYSWDGKLTYKQLDTLSSQLARYLRYMGVGPKVMVPICFEKSLWTIVAMLGIVKTGGAFVPLNPAHPASRLQTVVSEINARVMLVSPTTAETCAGIADHIVQVSAASLAELVKQVDERAAASGDATKPMLTPEDVAYIIFTSGSTGKPKGIVVEHGPLCSSIRSQARDFGIAADSRVLQFSSYVFDACIADIFVTLCSGGTVCVPSDADRLQNIAGFIQEARVNTAIALTPSFVATINPDEVPTLKKLFVGAEAPTKETLTTWFDRLHLRNVYGPTETVMICMSYPYQSTTESPLTIGRPFTGRLWVVNADDHNKLAPIGCTGELLIEGTTLVQGYLNDPVKTNASFINSVDWWPVEALGAKTRFYKTGDLVRFNTNGTVAYVGRKDTQVKVRGQRIELGEIEHTIRNTLPHVEHVAVDIVRRDGDVLVAFVVFDDLDESATSGVEDPSSPILAMDEAMRQRFAGLGDQLRSSLPPYMVPSLFIPLRAMLFNASMKMDRMALRALCPESAVEASKFVLSKRAVFEAPADELEIRLRQLWAQVLHIAEEEISVLDNFYDLGGDSIRIVTLNKLVRKAHDTTLSVRQMTSHTITIRSLAELVNDARGGAPVRAAPTVDLMAELSTVMKALPVEADGPLVARPITQLSHGAIVFLTGATGYLGTEILKQLLLAEMMVVALVRSTSPEHGLERIKRSAHIAGWWKEENAARVEVWPGDLSHVRLGLDAAQWARLRGDADAEGAVDAVLHNGAVVNWNANFGMLRAANVQSTADLLGAVAASPRGAKLVYISGGLPGDTQADLAATAAEMATSGNGYAQTKFLSESAVHEVSVGRLPAPQNRVSTVKPGMIIGGADGVCNIDDYVWRVVATAVSVRAFPEEPADHWMPIASVQTVAAAAVGQLTAPGVVEPFVDLQSIGLPAQSFWETVSRELDIACRPVSWSSWMDLASKQMNEMGETHPLWPVQHFLGASSLSSPAKHGAMEINDREVAAVQRSLQYLLNIGFITLVPGEVGTVSADAIARS